LGMKRTSTTEETLPRLGVIEALSLGYQRLLHYWEVMLVPIVLDLFFWLGPHLSIRHAVESFFRQAPPEALDLFRQMMGGSSPAQVEWLNPGPNLLVMLTQVPGAPTTIAALGTLPLPHGWPLIIWETPSLTAAIGISVLLMLLGTLVAGFYMALAARPVMADMGMTGPFLSRALWTGSQLALLVIGGLFLGFLAVVGMAFLFTLIYLVVPGWALGFLSVITLAFTGAMFMALLFFYFVPESLVLQRTHVWTALGQSMMVVINNGWSSMAFILLSVLIMHGFAYIWLALAHSLTGALVSIVGNAFLTAGLTIASLYFFQNRLSILAQLFAQAAQRQGDEEE